MTGNTKIKRKRLFVDKQVQGSLIRQLLLHWTLACGLIVLYLFTMQAFSNGFALTFGENLNAIWQQYGLLALVLLVISPVFIYDSIKLSNRFAGPMISFRTALNKLANGQDPEAINFRENDYWKELANDLNKISSELKTQRQQQAAVGNGNDTEQELAESH